MELNSGRDSMFIVSIIENRAREVGLAALDLRTSSIHLSQFVETSRSYQNTVTLLQYFDAGVIILPAKSAAPVGMVGLASVVDQCTDATKVPLSRSCFDDTKGMLMLQNFAAKDATALCLENYQKQYYLCLGAAAALFNWTEHQHGCRITRSSLQVIFDGSLNHMNIDATSILNLEVIGPLHLDYNTQNKKHGSLYGMLSTTKTVGGARLLRANLLQPLKDIGTINARLQALDELTSNEQLFIGLSEGLEKFPRDTDRVLCNFCFKRRKVVDYPAGVAATRRSQAIVAGIIVLKEALELLPLLSQALQHANSSLLCDIRDALGWDLGYSQLSKRISDIISEDVLHGGSAFVARTQQCFAVKKGVDGFLDVARVTFNSISEAIHALRTKYREEFDLPTLRLFYSNRHGFYFAISEQDLQEKQIPSIFLQVVKRGNNFYCSSDELISLNSRHQEAAAECYIRTEQCLEALTNHIQEDVRLLSLLSESVSLLDMLVNSFATMLSKQAATSYIRPEFTENGPLVIEAGRHPVVEVICTEEFVPNNTFLTEVANLILVTGPNMSGKSTYLRQVALITILAHIGCYVPAQFASFRVVDHLFTRIGTGDNLELNSSTFMTEMRETAFLMQNVSNRSLIVIDELGRGTSTCDGFAIAWSCSEFLLSLKAYVIFATHMQRLSELSSLYPDIKSCCFSVIITGHHLDFKFLLQDGRTDVPHYGLLLSEIAGIPPSVTTKACTIAEDCLRKQAHLWHRPYQASHCPRGEYHVAQRLLSLQHSHQTRKRTLSFLKNLKEQLQGGRTLQ